MYAPSFDHPQPHPVQRMQGRPFMRWATGMFGAFILATHVHAALVAEYRFEETSYNGTAGEVADYSGNGRHGKMVGSVTSTASGKTCRGITIPNNTTSTVAAFDTGLDVNTIGNEGTITFWMNLVKVNNDQRMLFDASTSASDKFFLPRDDEGAADVDTDFTVSNSSGTTVSMYENDATSDEVWVHVAASWKYPSGTHKELNVYINGALADSGDYTGTALSNNIGTLYFGDNRSASSEFLESTYGTLDQIRIYNTALTLAEVQADRDNVPSCSTLHHMEVTSTVASAATGASVVFTIKACANAACSSLYTGGVSGNLAISGGGVSVTYTTGASFSIAAGSSSTTETVTMSPAGTVTVGLSSVAPTASGSPAVYCGIATTATSGGSCAFTVGSSVHHMELTATSSTSVTCTPITYTVKACANADCSSTYTGGMTGTLSVSGVTVNYPSGAGFSIANGSATTTVSAHATTAGTATASLTGLSITPSNTPQVFCGMGAAAASGGSCAITTVDSALLFDVSNHVSEVAQSSVTVSAVRSSNNATVCTPAFASVSKNVTFKCTYSNPTTGTKAVRVGGGALNASNNASAACDTTGRAVSLSFNASGVATTSVQYADVGQVGMTARYDGSGSDAGLVMQGSDTFIAAPASFTIAGVPAGNIAAGSNFATLSTVTVTAKNNAGNTTPNFGNETSPATATLGFSKYRPTSAYNGTFSGTLGSFSNGVATASALSWTEVGSGDLTASLSGASYLGTGMTASGTTGSTGAVGPFIPHHFTVGTTNACSTFTYSGQPFTATVTAVNAAGDRTYNYDGTGSTSPNFAKAVTLSAATNGGTGSMTSASIAASSFGTGVATVTVPTFTFTSKQTAPTTITVRATDTDGVSSSGYSEGSLAIRGGRLKLSNAFGNGESALGLEVQAQYWSGKAWILSAGDNCTSLPANAVALSNYTNHQGATGSWTTTPSAITISNGLGTLSLTKPSPAGSTGTVDVALNLGSTTADNACLGTHPATTGGSLSWLRSKNGNCAVTFDRDPAARATFGIYAPETKKVIHVRGIN